MKRFFLTSAAVALCVSNADLAEAQAPAGQFYLQLDGGAAFLGDNEADGADIEYDTGFAVGGRVGYRATHQVRVEADISYISAEIGEIDGVDLNDVGIDADVSALTFDVGAYADFFRSGIISAYAGAGVGVAYKELDTNIGDDDETDVTTHAEAGIGFDLTPNIEIVPHYRFVWLPNTFDDEQFAHLLRLGLRYNP